MEIEIRTHNNIIPENFWELDADCLVIGSIACFHKLSSLDKLQEIYCLSKEHDKKIKVMIPITYQAHFDRTVNYIEHIINNYPEIMISFNDWGVLYEISQRTKNQNISNLFSVSQGIIYSYLENPWLVDILRNEREEIRNELKASYNISTKKSFARLRKFNVREIEIQYLAGLFDSVNELKENGFTVNAFMDYWIISFARACHVCRLKKVKPGHNCQHLCSRPYLAKIAYAADIPGVPLINEVSEETRKLVPEYYTYGNEIYYKNNDGFDAEGLSLFDKITIDARFYSSFDDLVKAVTKIRDNSIKYSAIAT